LDPDLPGGVSLADFKDYADWVKKDVSRQLTIAAKVAAFEQNHADALVDVGGAGRMRGSKRLLENVRAAKHVKTQESSGRRLVGRWSQAVPVEKWEETFPGEPLPGEVFQGMEKVEGVWTKVAYITKAGCQKNVYDIEAYNDDAVVRDTDLAHVEEDDSEAEEAAARTIHDTAVAAVRNKNATVNAADMTDLLDSALRGEARADDDDDSGPECEAAASVMADVFSCFAGPEAAPKGKAKAAAKGKARAGPEPPSSGGALGSAARAGAVATPVRGVSGAAVRAGAPPAAQTGATPPAKMSTNKTPTVAAGGSAPTGLPPQGDAGTPAEKKARGRPMKIMTQLVLKARDAALQEIGAAEAIYERLNFSMEANLSVKEELKDFRFALSVASKEVDCARAACGRAAKSAAKVPAGVDQALDAKREDLTKLAAAVEGVGRITKAAITVTAGAVVRAVMSLLRRCRCARLHVFALRSVPPSVPLRAPSCPFLFPRCRLFLRLLARCRCSRATSARARARPCPARVARP